MISDFPANRSIPSFSSKSAKTAVSQLCHRIGQNRRFPAFPANRLKRPNPPNHGFPAFPPNRPKSPKAGFTANRPNRPKRPLPRLPRLDRFRVAHGWRSLDIASGPPRRCRQSSLDKPGLNQVKRGRPKYRPRALFTTPSCGRQAPDVERVRIRSEGVKDHQGLVDDHR